jgi:hypothetical protein
VLAIGHFLYEWQDAWDIEKNHALYYSVPSAMLTLKWRKNLTGFVTNLKRY